MQEFLRSYAEISLGAIGANIAALKGRLKKETKLLVAVKADAYGHGAIPVASYLADKVDYLATATLEEAETLRAAGIRTPILILGYVPPEQCARLIAGELTATALGPDYTAALLAAAEGAEGRVKLHLAIDTGMTRVGFHPDAETAETIAALCADDRVFVEGIFTHLSCADQADQRHTRAQLARFDSLLSMLDERRVRIPIRHACNSAGIIALEDARYEMVRTGIAAYGIDPSEEVQKTGVKLTPALSWHAQVIHLQDVPQGTAVSYGATYRTERETTRIATVAVGYADGYPRALSNRGEVLIRGRRAKILGRVCMDQMMIDVTDISGVQVRDTVTLIGADGAERISVEEIADPAARFSYEQLCAIGPRVIRRYV